MSADGKEKYGDYMGGQWEQTNHNKGSKNHEAQKKEETSLEPRSFIYFAVIAMHKPFCKPLWACFKQGKVGYKSSR